MSVLGMIVSGVVPLPPAVYLRLDCGNSSGRRSLRWSRDETSWHFHRVVLFRSVQPYFLSILAEYTCGLGLGELTFLQLSTTYAPVIAGRSVGYVFLGNQRYAATEGVRQLQTLRVWNRRSWACWGIPLVGAPKPWRTSWRGVIISKSPPVYCYLCFPNYQCHVGSSIHDTSRVLLPPPPTVIDL